MAYKLSWHQFGEDRESFRYTLIGVALLLRKLFRTGVTSVTNVKLTKLL